MKVKIVKSSSVYYWYSGLNGTIYEVTSREEDPYNYYVVGSLQNEMIRKCDCEVVNREEGKEETFIQLALSGEDVVIKNSDIKMNFIGYAFESSTNSLYISDETGECVCTTGYYHKPSAPCNLVIQEKKKLFHTVAYKSKVSLQWELSKFSDEQLGQLKRDWDEYRIIETTHE